ncbi:helix-turn-helix transcriptional regulator [Nocardia sp. BSTN01]|uniref:helix-turn-helix domain-containing protein n=1 Tax=Nocardia sp. BSTN01 TaxID=2783665 RepID=UPI00188E4CD0|nr:helix-turn-helix transcriptional regulator [Nocardia sp. BSTN01]MBF5002523.1 helix-turn-helix transcriptional regulator [Nocardia sp. BSTN01]
MVTANPANVKVGNRVREAIERSGIPKGKIVAQSGIAQVTLDRKIRGRTSFTAEELIILSEYLDVDPAEFVAGIKAEISPSEATA